MYCVNTIRLMGGGQRTGKHYLLDVLWCEPIKLIQVVSTSEFHEY